MPVNLHYKDGKYWYQFGTTGKKYYFKPNTNSMDKVHHLALKQAAAIHASEYYRRRGKY